MSPRPAAPTRSLTTRNAQAHCRRSRAGPYWVMPGIRGHGAEGPGPNQCPPVPAPGNLGFRSHLDGGPQPRAAGRPAPSRRSSVASTSSARRIPASRASLYALPNVDRRRRRADRLQFGEAVAEVRRKHRLVGGSEFFHSPPPESKDAPALGVREPSWRRVEVTH